MIGKWLRVALVFFLLCGATCCNIAANVQTLALVGGSVYASPDAAPLPDAVVVTSGGTITAIGSRGTVQIPPDARIIDCTGKTVVAGFWNSHVHFTQPAWRNAASAPAASLEEHMREMLTKWGFTTVWDLGSEPNNTLALRRRIESGEILGPQILMAGDIFPQNGHPVYLPAEMQLPEAASPQQAEQMAQQYMKMGLDGMKLFTGAFMGNKPVVNMDTAIVKAAVDVAHAEGKPAFAHPQNRVGVDHALAGGVDVLAHTIPSDGPEGSFSAEEFAQMKRQHTALIPTLTLWTTVVADPVITDKLVNSGVGQLKAYFSEGGTILFGTDVGFTSRYDTAQEFEYMGRAMGWRDVLASLTSNPSTFFKQPAKGRLEKGMAADLVVLDADPASDVRNFSKVAYTIREGKIIYSGHQAE